LEVPTNICNFETESSYEITQKLFKNGKLRKLVQGMLLLACVLEVPSLNVSWGTDYPE
jgi:hypothetical protein